MGFLARTKFDGYMPDGRRLYAKGGGGSTTTVQKADPWEGVQPYLKELYQQAGNWFTSEAPEYFPGSTMAGVAPETLAAEQATVNRALTGSPLNQQAQTNALSTLQGDFLYGNPYLESMYERAVRPISDQFSQSVLPGIASQFSAAGRYGSGAQQQALGRASDAYGRTIGDVATGLYGGAYENERQRQQATMLAAPQLANIDYDEIARLAGVGASRTGREQGLINADVERFNFGQNYPLMKLQSLNQILTGAAPYASSTTTGPGGPQQNPLMGALGGLSTAYGLGSAAGIGGLGATGGLAAIGPVGWGVLGLGALAGSGLFS